MFFSKKKKLIQFNIKSRKIKTLEYNRNQIKGFLRQKEVLLINKDSTTIESRDLISDKSRWVFESDHNIAFIMKNQQHILLRLTPQTYVVLDHFTGEKLDEITINEENIDVKWFYLHNNKWVVLANDTKYEFQKKIIDEKVLY